MLVGLTGGIGSGKSTVSALLAERGAAVIDADAISRAATAPGGSALPAIAAAFGPQLIGSDGALDRAAMRALVFRDAGNRARLEAIIHPLVSQETDRQARQALAQGRALIVFDVPLLVEAGARWRARVDRVLVVDCDRATQIERVQARSQLPPDEIERIVQAQATRGQRLAAADIVVANGAGVTIQMLQHHIRKLAILFGL
ncbi:MAG: dephospho-CoA kinase [Desulfovibrionaceae bacterium]|jgi:dephospho-CoA kinase|nr:dephospho-CoA kinase [Desulfovibrionaceae bacterium]